MKNSERIYFKINGEFITKHFREICLEGRWNEAKIGLIESFGSHAEVEGYVNLVLNGDMEIQGEARIGTEDTVNFVSKIDYDYKEELSRVYTKNVICLNNKFYKIISIINTIDKNDRNANLFKDRARFYNPGLDETCFINNAFCTLKNISTNEIPPYLVSKIKESNYIDKNLKKIFKDVIIYGITEDTLLNESTQRNQLLDIVAYVKDPDGFYESHKDVLNKNEIESFNEDEAFNDEVYYRNKLTNNLKENIYLTEISDLRNKIKEQADNNGGYMLIGNEETGSFNVPKNAFLNWAYKIGNYKLDKNIIPKWDYVSPQGMKMYGDCQYHTDFVIGAGYNPEDFYNNKNFESAAYSAVYELRDLDMITLSGEGQYQGKIIIVDKDTDIEDCVDKIIVSKTADIEIFEQAKVAKLVIVENGGPGSHLVVNSREFSLNVVLLKNAMSLTNAHNYLFDLNKETFTINEY